MQIHLPPTDRGYPLYINFPRKTQGQAFDLLEQFEERVNRGYRVRGVASIDRGGTTAVWRPKASGGCLPWFIGRRDRVHRLCRCRSPSSPWLYPFLCPPTPPLEGWKTWQAARHIAYDPKRESRERMGEGRRRRFQGFDRTPPPCNREDPCRWIELRLNARRRHYFRKFRGPGKPYNFATPRPEIRHLWGGIRARQEFFKWSVETRLFGSFKSSLYYIYTLVDIGERNGKNKLFLGMGRLKRREDYYYYYFFLDILKNSCQYFYLFPCSINLVNMKIERLKLFQEHWRL